MIDGPRSLKEEEYDEFMRLLERSYERIREFFQNGWPHVSKRETIEFKNRFIIKKDGRIVSHVGLIPLTLVVDDKLIRAGGIGGVATDPDFRGSGFMSELLKYTISKMRENELPVSILWGDRDRYGRYGWENAGTVLNTAVSRRNLKKLNLTEKVEAKKYAPESGDLKRIMEIHEQEPLRVQRSEKKYRMFMSKPGQDVWLGKGRDGWAYAVISGGNVIERGGNPGTFLALLADICEKTGTENLQIIQPLRLTPLADVLCRICGAYSMGHIGMVKIIDLDATLKSFGVKTDGIKFKMMDTEEDKFKPIEISGKEIKLPEQAMVRLLFGQMPPSRSFKIEPEIAKTLDSIFPLGFYVWQLDGV